MASQWKLTCRELRLPIQFRILRLVAAIGAAVVVIGGLSYDYLIGTADPRIGTAQVMGTLAAILAFATAVAWRQPILAIRAIDARAFRWSFCAAIALATFALHMLAPKAATPWLAPGYGLALAVVLPLRLGLVSFALIVTGGALLSAISDVKKVVSGMPLTMLDARVALQHPEGLTEALGLSSWPIVAAVAILVLALIAVLLAGVSDVQHARQVRLMSRGGLLRVAAALLLAGAGYAHLNSISRYLAEHDDAWRPAGLAELSDEVGIVAFLYHSARLESGQDGPIFDAEDDEPPLESQEIREAVNTYIHLDSSAANQRPNILVVLTESTFDPGKTFHVTGRWDERLFTPNENTRLFSELRVNTLGGGTWISEFETIVGLDSRLFGYYGYYTHSGVSPFITGSLASHLRERGYRTMAFFPHPRELYEAQPAYERYGFENVYDARDLWNMNRGWLRDDRRIASTVRVRLEQEVDSPLFAYVKLVENHWPHACDASAPRRFAAVFDGSADHATNCALNVYLQRMIASADAIDTLRAFMIESERRTGRPYVLLNFGDHQPHIFTGTTEGSVAVDQFRTERDPHITYVHLESSASTAVTCCSTPLPIAAIPTILSAFAADGADDVYLGENLWLYAQCGADAFFAARDSSRASSGGCARAFRRAVAAFSRSSIVRLH